MSSILPEGSDSKTSQPEITPCAYDADLYCRTHGHFAAQDDICTCLHHSIDHDDDNVCSWEDCPCTQYRSRMSLPQRSDRGRDMTRMYEQGCYTDPEDPEEFCPDCFAGMESSEHHEKCVAFAAGWIDEKGFPYCDTCGKPAVFSEIHGNLHVTSRHPWGVQEREDASGHRPTFRKWSRPGDGPFCEETWTSSRYGLLVCQRGPRHVAEGRPHKDITGLTWSDAERAAGALR